MAEFECPFYRGHNDQASDKSVVAECQQALIQPDGMHAVSCSSDQRVPVRHLSTKRQSMSFHVDGWRSAGRTSLRLSGQVATNSFRARAHD
jgi:hypothetical protein